MRKRKEEIEQQGVQLPLTPSDLDKNRWIKTPLVYARQGATLNRMQTDVLLMVSDKLQTFINQFYQDGRNRLDIHPNSAVPESAFTKEKQLLPIRLEMTDLVENYHYDRLDEALKDMRSLELRVQVHAQRKNEDGALLFDTDGNPLMHDVMTVMPLFQAITVPKTETEAEVRKGYIDLDINFAVASTVFDMSQGYVEHIARIARDSQTDSTSKIYLLLKDYSFKQHSKTVKIDVKTLKTATGHIIYNKKTGEQLSETYMKWSEYVRRILNPVQRDLHKMALKNKVEFSFTFVNVYKNGRKRGNPDYVEFTIIPSALGIAHKSTKGKAQSVIEQDLFANNPESKVVQAQKDWQMLLDKFQCKSELKKILLRSEFCGANDYRDRRGRVHHYFCILPLNEDRKRFEEDVILADYEKLRKFIVNLFGTRYYSILWMMPPKKE